MKLHPPFAAASHRVLFQEGAVIGSISMLFALALFRMTSVCYFFLEKQFCGVFFNV